MDFESICIDMIKRSRALFSIIQSVQGTIDTVDLLYGSDEDLNEHQAVAQYLWSNVLPDIEPALMAPGEGWELFLMDGDLNGKPHSWIALQITAPPFNTDAYQIILETYFPGGLPQVLVLDTDSPILPLYHEKTRYRVGEAPE